MTEPVTQGDQELHNTVVGTLQAENKQYAHNSSLCKPETEENRLDSQEWLELYIHVLNSMMKWSVLLQDAIKVYWKWQRKLCNSYRF